LDYLAHVRKLLDTVAESQAEALGLAAHRVADSLLAGGVLHVFGTGHSHMAGEELFFRAGGLAPVNAILFPPLMQHAGPLTSTRLERLPGLAAVLFDKEDLRPGEVLIIVSNSGKNAVPVEFAALAKARGLFTVALTSLAQSRAAALGQGQARKLHEVCDAVIDNGGTEGDAAIQLPGLETAVCPTSSVVNLALMEELVRQVCLRYLEAGEAPPVFKSANLPGGDAWNDGLVARYGDRVRFR